MSQKVLKNCLKGMVALSLLLNMQIGKAQYDFAAIDQKLTAASKDIGKKFAMLVYKDGKIIFKKEAGEFNGKEQVPIQLASSWYTVAMVMTFVDQGKISLDDYVGSYLPIFNKYGKKYITIRHCLSHYTGIESSGGHAAEVADYKHAATLEEVVNTYASKREIEDNPGTYFKFSHIGLAIAARVCEIVGKRGFDQMISERVLRPCGMKATNFDTDKAMNPTSGGFSCGSDYINFLSMLLNGGIYNGRQVLSKNSVEEILKIQSTEGTFKFTPELTKGDAYALGSWVLETTNSGKPQSFYCPALSGTFPIIDLCKGYAAILIVKQPTTDLKRKFYLDLKASIDEAIGGNCKIQ